MSGGKTISLKELRGKTEHQFSFAHALALLRKQKAAGHIGWEISDKNWKFEGDEIIRRESIATGEKRKGK